MTNQERTKILEMVASGKLTIEQADQLLERLGAQSLADAEKRPDQRLIFTRISGGPKEGI